MSYLLLILVLITAYRQRWRLFGAYKLLLVILSFQQPRHMHYPALNVFSLRTVGLPMSIYDVIVRLCVKHLKSEPYTSLILCENDF
ncbi:hypothetical protein BX666DRAFT_1895641 [Dichotomocladium elegans]|nr:hypothetical protein BX666DRAFT_1895641 [Dichotomocladium elegans]